jgi:hypothetical protein
VGKLLEREATRHRKALSRLSASPSAKAAAPAAAPSSSGASAP